MCNYLDRDHIHADQEKSLCRDDVCSCIGKEFDHPFDVALGGTAMLEDVGIEELE